MLDLEEEDRINPERFKNLITSVIRLGVVDGDVEYFKSKTFEEHCYLLGVPDTEVVREKFLKAIEARSTNK